MDEAAVNAVLTASRTLVAVATQSLGAGADETTIAQYRALVVSRAGCEPGPGAGRRRGAAVIAGTHAVAASRARWAAGVAR